MTNSKNCFFLPPRILTFWRLCFFILPAILLIASNASADVVVQYLDDMPTGILGDDVGVVSNTIGTEPYNIIKILNTDEVTASHNVSVTNLPSSYSVLSATSGESQTVSAGAVQQYSLSASEYTISIADVNYKGNSSTLNCWGDFMNVPSSATVNLTLNNVSFSEFKTNYSGGVFNVEGELNITSNSEISFTNNHADNTNGSNKNGYGMGAVFHLEGNGALNIDGKTIQFSNNSSNRFGAISSYVKCPVSITGSVITFENNSSANTDGAAIMTNGRVTITGKDDNSVTTFRNNTSRSLGGAISAQSYAIFSKGSFYFDNNKLTARVTSNYHGGGAIDTRNLSITDATVVSFTNNESLYGGGAVNITSHTAGDSPNGLIIQADQIIFDNNTSKGFGGAIGIQADCTSKIEGNSISFTNNQTSGYTECDGGAIRGTGGLLTITGSGENSELIFQNNSAARYGGAISTDDLSMSSFKTIKFYNNKSNNQGGAFYCYSVAFEGDDTTAYFIGNTAANAGNDIYLISSDRRQTYLNFKGNGTYIFDGGIYLETGSTTIYKARVSLSGRENDSTNVYRLQNVTISNGGKLTANLDNINKIEGTQITLSDSVSLVELTNALMNQTATVKSSTDNGTFLVEYSAADGNVQNESLVISSGRIDIKGAMAGSLDVEDETTFSPGNSVGSVNIDGDFKLTGELLMEVDGTGADVLTCGTFTMNGGTAVLNWQNDEIPFFSTLDIIISESTDLSEVYNNLVENIDFSTSPTVEQLYKDGYIKVLLVGDGSNIIRLSIDRNAVPEPSTWALLILGAAGLLYIRKRK